MMAKYRKKPIVVEAMQYDGFNYQEIAGFVGPSCFVSRKTNAPVLIQTLEGPMIANVGDWIIKGTEGEFYPCKPDAFEATYEAL